MTDGIIKVSLELRTALASVYAYAPPPIPEMSAKVLFIQSCRGKCY